MSKYLLQIHIGPMQTFIAAARRTRDLWFGSWLMSELSKAAAWGIAEQDTKNSLIFPAQGRNLAPDSGLGVSNKIVALAVDPEKAARAAKDALEKRYDNLIVAASLESKLEEAAWHRANKQLHSFLELYWVSYPLGGDYAQARKYADTLLAARKSSRNFKPVNWNGTRLPKSSLDGRMETVTPKKADNQTEAQYVQQMYKQFRVRLGERLSGVDLLKRLGEIDNDKSRFPSTSHMAAILLKTRLETNKDNPAMGGKWEAYLKALRAKNPEIESQEIIYHDLQLPILGRLDGALLFESRLLDFVDKSEMRPLNNKLNAFLSDVLKGAEVSEPIPYYALLVGDGDSMGKTIDALLDDHDRMDETIKKLEKWERHQTFSKKLAAFAKSVRKIVGEHDGAVVYAGGDDVLALLPLHTAVSCAALLAQKFQSKMEKFKDKNGRVPTFSAGVAMVHHLEPLEDALDLARKAEKTAKAYKKEDKGGKTSEKNALAVTLNKRSGAPRTIVGHWGEIDERLSKFAHHYRQNNLPMGLAHQLRRQILHLGGQTAVKNNTTLQQVIAKEAERIIGRKERTETAAKDVVAAVQALDHQKNTLETLSSELIIAAHIAQAQDLAKQEVIV